MSWGSSRSTNKVDNGAKGKRAKIQIRSNVLDAIGGPAHVFDAFAGSGTFYREIWHRAASYTGCDLRYFPDDRRAFVADNRRVLRAIDLTPFNVFDLDAYGSPWAQAVIIAARRKVAPGETIGFVFTEAGLLYRNNAIPIAVTEMIGLRSSVVPDIYRRRHEVASAIFAELARRMDCVIVRRWQAENAKGSSVAYFGLVVRGIVPQEKGAAVAAPDALEMVPERA
jgi:hypothetical protein